MIVWKIVAHVGHGQDASIARNGLQGERDNYGEVRRPPTAAIFVLSKSSLFFQVEKERSARRNRGMRKIQPRHNGQMPPRLLSEYVGFSLEIRNHEFKYRWVDFFLSKRDSWECMKYFWILEPSYHQHNLKSLATFQMQSAEGSYFSPGVVFHVQTPPITETVPTNIPHVQVRNKKSFVVYSLWES